MALCSVERVNEYHVGPDLFRSLFRLFCEQPQIVILMHLKKAEVRGRQ